MSSNVTTPIMIGIDNNGNYKAVRVNSQDGGISDLNSTAIGGALYQQDIYKIADVIDVNSDGNNPVKLAVDQYKYFQTIESYQSTNQNVSNYTSFIAEAILSWSLDHGKRYDDIIISVTTVPGALSNNINMFVTIIRYY
jgi:hypothetical protein